MTIEDHNEDVNIGNETSLELGADRLPPRFIQTRGNDKTESFAVNYLNELFRVAMKSGVSDVHFESMEIGCICRIRKNGDLVQYKDLLSDMQYSVIREKIYARGMIEESLAKNSAVDARGWLRFDNRLDLRISSIPTTHGYSIVIRLLDQSNAGRSLDTIEMTPEVKECVLDVIHSAHGLIVITGQTGSGKTTTLYSYLNELNSISRKIFTIENPVEYTIPNVQHINVDNHISFNQGLRAALRQDPDVILIGEIRDAETAKIAVEAAQTGHLVLSTLHTNSSVGALSRLMELGVDASHINETLLAVSAQRLVRKCKDVRNVAEPSDGEKEWLRKNGFPEKTKEVFGRGTSPENYKGRLPVIELLIINDEIREKIALGKIDEVYALAEKQAQYETVTKAAIRLAQEGKTSLEEAINISGAKALMNMEGMLLSERLLALKYITQYQLDYAKDYQRSLPEISRQSLKKTLLDLHFCSYEQLQEAGDAPDA